MYFVDIFINCAKNAAQHKSNEIFRFIFSFFFVDFLRACAVALRSKSVRKALLRSGPGLRAGLGSGLCWPGIPLSFGLAVALS